jgi:Tol biopolymer transport system component
MTPEIFAPGIISKSGSDEWGLAVNADGNEIFFSRSENDKATVFHTKYQSGAWSKPVVASFSGKYLERPFTDQLVHAAYVSSDEDIYASGLVVFKKHDSGYGMKEKLHPDVIGNHPAISHAGDFIVFSNRTNDGFGGTDLYVIYKNDDDSWSAPINLGKTINTSNVESSPTISQDGRFLFFSRNGDIWWISTIIIDILKQKS